MKDVLTKIKSIKLCLMAHPDNERGSEFADRISDCEEIESRINQQLSKTKKLHSIKEFMISMGFETTDRIGIYKHRYFVNEHYIEFDLSACALEKWAVMQHIFVKLLSVGESLKAKEICNVLGVAQHSI